jgi:hypothetical protein
MNLKDIDIKKLWGLSAGRCNYPACNEECIKFLNDEATVIGEMAHMIAQSESGPRGISGGGDDSYENLILLCPTHHKVIDKAPAGTFPVATLQDWKNNHERAVATSFDSPLFSLAGDLCRYIQRLLAENKVAWETYGPDSGHAQRNPVSNAKALWILRKMSLIVPNNRKIISALKRNATLLDGSAYATASAFMEHAEGFEHNCYDRTEGVSRFPHAFEEMINVCSAL